jgi:heterodisulfide reductase subunit D
MTEPAFNFPQLLQIEACTNCRMCADICPAVLASGQGNLSGVYRLSQLRKVLDRKYGLLSRLLGRGEVPPEKLKEFSETVFRCTLCGNCQEVCPVGLELKGLWLSLRNGLASGEGTYPEKNDRILENLLESRNVFDEDNEERAEWVEDLDDPPEDGHLKDKAKVVYFTGCVASYFPLAQRIPIHLTQIFEQAELDFTLLGEEEWCCGFPLFGAGFKDATQEFIRHNVEAVREKGAGTVVFSCPSCYQTWRDHYPPEFELIHSTQFLAGMARQGRLPFKETPMTVTYHDPCDLGRGTREFDAPREVIRAIPGMKLVELPDSRENCLCCGGGGNLETIAPELAGEIARRKIEHVLETGAQAVITACQQCVRTMTAYVRRNQVPIEVLDISELVWRSCA